MACLRFYVGDFKIDEEVQKASEDENFGWAEIELNDMEKPIHLEVHLYADGCHMPLVGFSHSIRNLQETYVIPAFLRGMADRIELERERLKPEYMESEEPE